MPLSRLARYIFNVFNVEPDNNISRRFNDMKIRNQATPFLDALTDALYKRMKRSKPKKKKDE